MKEIYRAVATGAFSPAGRIQTHYSCRGPKGQSKADINPHERERLLLAISGHSAFGLMMFLMPITLVIVSSKNCPLLGRQIMVLAGLTKGEYSQCTYKLDIAWKGIS